MDQIDQLLADAENTLHQASAGMPVELPQSAPQLNPDAIRQMVDRAVSARVGQVVNSLGIAQSQYVQQIPAIAEREIAQRVSQIKIPRDGKDGRDGVHGKDGKHGRDGKPGKNIERRVGFADYERLKQSDGAAQVAYLYGVGLTARSVENRLRDALNLKDFGVVGDATGVTGVGTNNATALQAAIDYCAANGITLRGSSGIYRYTTGLIFPTNLNLVMDEDCVLFFDGTGNSLAIQKNWSSEVPAENIHIIGGQFWGRSDGSFAGIGMRMYCNNFVMHGTKWRYMCGNGVAVWFGGNVVRIYDVKVIDSVQDGPSGGGGLRCFGGSDILVHGCHVESDDDCYVLGPAESASVNGDLSIDRAWYVNCTGSTGFGRLAVAGCQDSTTPGGMTCSITNSGFVNVTGQACIAAGLTVHNTAFSAFNVDSSGEVANITWRDCYADIGGGGSGGSGAIVITNASIGGTGSVHDILLDNVKTEGQDGRALAISTTAGTVYPYGIRIKGGSLGANISGGVTVAIGSGNYIYFDGATINGTDADVVDVGTSATVNEIHFKDTRFLGYGGTGTARYAVDLVATTRATVEGCTCVEVSGASTTRCVSVGASASNVTIVNNDFSQVSGAAANRVAINAAATNIWADKNKGYVTYNKGTDTITSGNTSVLITHGCNFTPNAADIRITMAENPTADVTRLPWVSDFSSTQVRVNVAADPGASNLDFGWELDGTKRQ